MGSSSGLQTQSCSDTRGGGGGGGEKREREGEGGGGGGREREKSNSKILFYKDCSLGLVRNLTTNPC